MGPPSEVKKGNHYAYEIHYLLVFTVKYRKALLKGEVEQVIIETARGIMERYDIVMEALGMDHDHLHLLCGSHLKPPGGSWCGFSRVSLPGRFSSANPR
ncbi:MAG: transposase [Candidatus Marinimicrobia bacterium]|nr:transposase [Candidatus Neomarinimicrobiota bacterium]MCF7880156.1 transposase [Candidatus Neomarinimicrobiota bacterium]